MNDAPKTRVRLIDGRVLTLAADPRYIRAHMKYASGDIISGGKILGQWQIAEVLDD